MAHNLKNMPGYTQFINTKFVDIKLAETVEIYTGLYVRNAKTVLLKSVAFNKYIYVTTNGALHMSSHAKGLKPLFGIIQTANDETGMPIPIITFGNKVNFKNTKYKRYITAEPDGSAVADRAILGVWEQFTIVSAEGASTGERVTVNSKVGLLSDHNKYLVGEKDGTVNANRIKLGAWEQFQIIVPDLGPEGGYDYDSQGA